TIVRADIYFCTPEFSPFGLDIKGAIASPSSDLRRRKPRSMSSVLAYIIRIEKPESVSLICRQKGRVRAIVSQRNPIDINQRAAGKIDTVYTSDHQHRASADISTFHHGNMWQSVQLSGHGNR